MSKKTVRRRRQNFTQETLKRKEGFKYKLIAEGVAIGLFAGLLVSLFQIGRASCRERVYVLV